MEETIIVMNNLSYYCKLFSERQWEVLRVRFDFRIPVMSLKLGFQGTKMSLLLEMYFILIV
jgi:hypothetical protein